MEIEAFLLCDCATQGQGKLNVLGAFDRIYSPKIPAVHPACTIAARIRFTAFEEGSHRIKINVVDADGNKAGPELEDNITVRVGDGESTCVRNLILNIQGLKLENFGDYRIDLAIDGRQEATLPLSVVEMPEQR
ncbi:MAG: DUF6941 family protein [Planctomycetota bacterium]